MRRGPRARVGHGGELRNPLRNPPRNCRIPSDASILIVQQEWLDKILDEDKDLEIRGQPSNKKGELIYLCASGASAVTGTAVFAGCLGPLTREQFDELRPRHKWPGQRPYSETYAYVLQQRQRMPHQPIRRKPGAIVWQKGPD